MNSDCCSSNKFLYNYFRAIAGVFTFLIGPWIGFTLFGCLTAYEKDMYFECRILLSQILLCGCYDLSCIILLGFGDSAKLFYVGIWWIIGIFFIVGHWVTFFIHEKTDHAHSLSELKVPYAVITVIHTVFMSLPATVYLFQKYNEKSYSESMRKQYERAAVKDSSTFTL
uniref:Uncharacterized protein n=1 Tax=Lepeophtheirus salmonis TaxID=72036 RepID=A0A0K2SZT3_LEPSM